MSDSADPVDYTSVTPFATSLFRALKIDPNKTSKLRIDIVGDDVPIVWAEYVTDEVINGEMVTEPHMFVVTEAAPILTHNGVGRMTNEVLDHMGLNRYAKPIVEAAMVPIVDGAIAAIYELGYRIYKPIDR